MDRIFGVLFGNLTEVDLNPLSGGIPEWYLYLLGAVGIVFILLVLYIFLKPREMFD